MELNNLRINASLVESGEWIGNIPGLGTIEFRVRGTGNSDWKKLYRRLVEELPREKRPGGVPTDDAAEQIVTRCLVETALLDWRNITDRGADLPYSREAAERIMLDPNMRRFRDGVAYAAQVVGEYREDDIASAGKS